MDMNQASFDAALQLEALLEQENALLRASDFATAASLAGQKEALMTALNQATLAAPEIYRDPDFTAIGVRLNRLVEENRHLLEIAMQVQLRLVRLVANARQTESVIYTRTGEALREPLPRGLTFAAQA
jgi:flagellar biosynthesis/type III secretory pathway chaperone